MKVLSAPLNRRRFLTTSAALVTTLQLQQAARALGLVAGSDVCKLNAEQEVGPFYISGEQLRSNIVEGKPGIPLSLRILLLDARTCKPLQNAAVDIWQCDAMGLYAGFTAQDGMGFGGPGGGPGGPHPGFDPAHPGEHGGPPPPGAFGGDHENAPTDKLTFLRGIQISDHAGAVNFKTIFPGFYQGRVNHIHFKVRLGGEASGHTYAAGHTSHTGQVFFPEELAVKLMQHQPYSLHKIHRTTLDEDHVFGDQSGRLSMAHLQLLDPDKLTAGIHADLIASVDPTATPAPVQGGPGGPPPA